jgi:hypothetical protein
LNNRALIVLGMHRSGTSAFTGVLGLLGVDLGPNLMPPSAANESGYWEHQEIVTIHESLLQALGSRWDDPSRLPPGWPRLEAVAPYRRKLREIIARDFADSPLWALKDPRMCRLLPLWTALMDEIGCQPVWIVVTRHPQENIGSLEKRDGFSPGKSGLLWLQHMLDAERETRGRNRVLITFDQLLDDWEATLDRVRRAAGLPWPAPPGSAEARIKEFVDPGKRHHRASNTGELPPWIRQAYEGLCAGAAGDEEKMQASLAPVNAAFDTADALYRPVIRDRAADLEAYLAEADARLAAISTAHAALREKYRVSKEKLASKSVESTSLKEQLRQYERSAGGKLNRLLRRVKPNPSRKDAPSNGT